MYRLEKSGRGKLFCYTGGLVPLNDSLSQEQLKELFNQRCEFVTYEQPTTTEAEALEPVRKEDTEYTSNGGGRRKANNRKGSKKPTAN